MENKIENKIEHKLTEREIFEQIVALQKQLTENSTQSLHRLGDAISSLCLEEGEANIEQVSEVCNVFSQREYNLKLILQFYTTLYEDLKKNK